MNANKTIHFLPSEWHPQSAIQLTWPDATTDWNSVLDQALECYVSIAKIISQNQKLIIVCNDPKTTKTFLKDCNTNNISLVQAKINDTWARDHGFISVFKNNTPHLLDFGFNGWGNKFYAKDDNNINRIIYEKNVFNSKSKYIDQNHFILEGGSIESDGEGTILTTSACLLSETRNPNYTKTGIENHLKETLGAKQILWLDHGYLSGDDTDSHIDTLARFCAADTIAYVKCTDSLDEHYIALAQMENELKSFRQLSGKPYKLIPLPMAQAVYDSDDNHRLPATYANFLIINKAVLLPIYNTTTDKAAIEAMAQAFPKREIIPVDCSILIKQHGSLHCISMQFPEGVL